MNNHIYQYLMEDKNKELELINRHAWKYHSNEKSSQKFSISRFLKILFKKSYEVKKVYNKGQ